MATGKITITNGRFNDGDTVDAYKANNHDFLPRPTLLGEPAGNATVKDGELAFTGLDPELHFFVVRDSDPPVFIKGTPKVGGKGASASEKPKVVANLNDLTNDELRERAQERGITSDDLPGDRTISSATKKQLVAALRDKA